MGIGTQNSVYMVWEPIIQYTNFSEDNLQCLANFLTVAAPPMGIQIMPEFNPNNTLCQLEVSWIPVVRIVSAGY